jgi:hypothetical protein
MRAVDVVSTVARPLFELGVVRVTRWALKRPADEPPGRGLWEPTGEARIDGGVHDEPKRLAPR